MKTRNARFTSILAVVFALGSASCASGQTATKDDVLRWTRELSNWGRWGKDDQLGALNLITPEKRREAAALIEEGVTVSLARDAATSESADNPQPFEHTMLASGQSEGQWCMDRYSVAFHGYAHTHMDALCHIFHEGKMYNGFSREDVTGEGAKKLGIQQLKNGIVTRAILMDIPRLKGVDYLAPKTPIYEKDLAAWEKRAGVKVGSGDVVLIRTGRWARRAEHGPWDVGNASAGLHASCAKWLRKRDIAVLGSDAASDVLPSGVDGVSHPIHLLMLNSMGVYIFDNLDLETLAAEAAKRGRWEFFIMAAPLAVPGGTGSPLNPIVTF